MKKKLLRVLGICTIIGGVFIGKYTENNKNLPPQKAKVAVIDTEYSQNEYSEHTANYDLNFRFPRESYTGKTYEAPKLINIIEQQRLDGMFFDIDKYKSNIIKERENKNTELGKEFLMNGYIHTYQFKDFGISIKTSNYVDDNEYFIENSNSMRRYIDKVYDVVYSNDKTRYVRRYVLGTGAIFNKEYLEQYNAFTGTIILKKTQTLEEHPIFNTGIVHLYQEPLDGSYSGDVGADEEGNQTIIYIYNPELQANYYYKIAYSNNCAPSCGIPELIDIIASK